MITKEHIIQVATQLFVEHGVKSVTTDRMVKELRTSKRTLYNHFADKTELLKAVLAVYHEKVRKENETIIAEADNALEAMAYLYHKIIQRSTQVNPSFFNDILHYYPGLLQESYRNTGNFAHAQLVQMAEWGIKDGIFKTDLDTDVNVKTVLSLLEMLKDTNLFPSDKYTKERLTFGIMIPYLRGLCTPKGLEMLEMHEELYKIKL